MFVSFFKKSSFVLVASLLSVSQLLASAAPSTREGAVAEEYARFNKVSLVSVTHVEEVCVGGSFTEKGYLARLKGSKFLFCKVGKEGYAEVEERALTALVPTVTQYEDERVEGMPKIAAYRGSATFQGERMMLFDKAQGTSVFDLLMHFALRDYPEDGELKQKRLDSRFAPIGTALAKFHIHFRRDEGPDVLNTMTHGDLHTSNLFMSARGSVLTFIDYETMGNGRADTDLWYLFNFSRNGADKLNGLVHEKARTQWFQQHVVGGGSSILGDSELGEKEAYADRRVEQLDEAFEAMASAYETEIKTIGFKLSDYKNPSIIKATAEE